MAQRVFLVHGWSVQETTTYQALHRKLAQYGDFTLEEVFLGRYVSLDDRVEIRDLAKALHAALDEKLDGNWDEPFHIITHSTGALVVRHWIARHYTGACSAGKPLRNLIFLAGPHFGSRLAHHGRSMLAHIRYLGDTGTQILKALELGSEYSWLLADAWLDPSNILDLSSGLDPGIDEHGEPHPSNAVHNIHENLIDPHHLTVFLEMKVIDPQKRYFIDLRASSGSPLFTFDKLKVDASGSGATFNELVREDETTQIEVVLSRKPSENLFVFHRGDDADLHARWDRLGVVVKDGLGVE